MATFQQNLSKNKKKKEIRITEEDMREIRGLKYQHTAVREVTDAVNIFFGSEPGWDNTLKLMANINEFIDRLNTYDKESIDSAMLAEIKPFKDQAQPERVRQILPACHQLALWVKCTYNHKGKKPS